MLLNIHNQTNVTFRNNRKLGKFGKWEVGGKQWLGEEKVTKISGKSNVVKSKLGKGIM